MEYRIAKGWRIAAIVFSLALIAAGIALIAFDFSNGNLHKMPELGIILGIFIIAIALILWIITIKFKLTIDNYSINQIGAFRNKSLLLDDVEGYRTEKYSYFLVSKSTAPSILISNYLENKNEFIAWMKRKYKYLDNPNLDKETKDILANANFGAYEEDRMQLFRQAIIASRIFNISAAVIAFWLMAFATPYSFAASLLVPPVSIYILWHFKGIVTINGNKKGQTTAYPSILPALLFSCILITLRATTYKVYIYAESFRYVLVIGFIMIAIIYYIAYKLYPDNVNKKPIIWGLAVLLLGFSYGATIFVNCYFDTAKAQIFVESITDKRISRGSKSTGYYITTMPWAHFVKPHEEQVSESLYNSLQLHDSVNICLQPGKLGIPWYFVDKK